MSIVAGILIAVGGIMSFIYGIILLIRAFQTSVVWGLVYLLVPFAAFVFIFKYWDISKNPFLMSLLGVGIMLVGVFLMPGGMQMPQ